MMSNETHARVCERANSAKTVSRTDNGPSAPTGAREAVRTLHPGYFALVMATGDHGSQQDSNVT
jgi:hypothetical protein